VVVLLPLVLVADHVVGGGDLLEPLFCVLVPGVRVGVELLGELPVGLLDVGGRGVLGHAEGAVVILVEPLPADLLSHARHLLRFR